LILAVVAVTGKPSLSGVVQAWPASLSDGLAAAGVLVVRGDVADAGVPCFSRGPRALVSACALFVQVSAVPAAVDVHRWCGARAGRWSVRGVESGDQFPVRGACGVEVLALFLELKSQINGALFEEGDLLL